MKKIAKVTLIMITVLASLCLTGCGKYVSSWSASAYVHTNTSSYAYMDFGTFKGTQVHTLKCKNETGTLNYSGKLEKGNVIVYVDYDGTKKELFKLSDGEEINSSLKNLKEGTVYVIFETDGKCENGEFEFEIE